tara:strand:+ start:20763 stop:21233 length:471 start_codon:yes stop_codon:yes gene_type:complete
MSQKYKVFINNKVKVITDNWDSFCSQYTLIRAAGGLVYNHENSLLMIFRNGKWDLPKGKLEDNESIEDCAIREVTEECGVRGLLIIAKVKDTYHVYNDKGKKILKQTSWFIMETNFDGVLVPQEEEGINKVTWIEEDKIKQKIKSSYRSIQDLLLK